MNVVRKDIDNCNAIISVEVSKEDYSEKVEKSLKDYRKKASMPGFRPGMVPAGLIKKMYGKSILAEELNKIFSDALYNYVKDNKINMLGEPLANETEQEELNFDEQENFVFKFDIGFVPEFAVEFDKKDKLPYYEIEITKEMEDKQIKMHQSQFGKYVPVDKSSEENLFSGDILEIGEGEFKVLDAKLTPKYMKDEAQKALFVGKKAGDVIIFNPVTAFENKYEISSLLNVGKENIQNYNRDFQYVIKEITKHQEAELNQELFDKVLGKDAVKDEKEFRTKIKEGLANSYIADSDYKFVIDVKEHFLKKIANVEFPVEFLKRWLLASNKKMTQETIEKEFDKMLDYLKWDLIKKQIADKNSLKIEENDVLDAAKKVAKIQFAQYGMNNMPDEMVENYAQEMLKKEENQGDFYERALESKVIVLIKEQVAISNKKVSLEEFNSFFN